MPEALFVKFRPNAARRLRLGAGLLLLAGMGLCALGRSDVVAEGSARLAKAVAIPIGLAAFAAIPHVLMLAKRWVSGRPALLVSNSGLRIGVTARRDLITLSWDEIDMVQPAVLSTGRQMAPILMIVFRDQKVAWRVLGPMGWFTDWKMSIRMDILDRPWDDIEAAIDRLRPRPPTPEEANELLHTAQDLARRLERARTHDGDLLTLADYRRVFAEAPVGHWNTYGEGTISPMDSAIALGADRTGWVGSLGLGAMGGAGTSILWQAKKPGVIEARRAEEGASWCAFSFEFSEEAGIVVLSLAFQDEDAFGDDEDDWTVDLTFERRKYGGPCESAR